MRHILTPLAVGPLLAASLFAAPPPGEAAKPHESSSFERAYELRFLDAHSAEVLAWQQCPPGADERCRVNFAAGGSVHVFADAATHEKIARALAERDVLPATHVFQVVLLIAENRGESALEGVPAGAQKALQDVHEFLPYRSYRLLDLAWLRTTQDAEATLGGPGGVDYRVHLHLRGSAGLDGDKLYIDPFRVTAGEPSGDRAPAAGPRADGGDAGAAPPAGAPHAAPPAPRPTGTVLSTSFGMTVGETVLVGTSRLDGGSRTLVVLLSAVQSKERP